MENIKAPFITIVLASISVGLATIQIYLSIAALLLTIGYTCWRWYRDWQRTKRRNESID